METANVRRKNGLRAYKQLDEWLTKHVWRHSAIKDTHAFSIPFARSEEETIMCIFDVDVDAEQFTFYGILDVDLASEKLPEVAEYLTRANYGLRIGNFELDFSDGEVRYKSSLDFEREMLVDNLIENTVAHAIDNIERYFDGLKDVAVGLKTPKEAILAIENTMTVYV